MSTITVYVPGDAGAVAVGADEVAIAIESQARTRGILIAIVRNGSHGLYWLEPLVEVVTDGKRRAYGPVRVADVNSLFEADFLHGAAHPLAHGVTDQIPYLREQERLTFRRVGITDPISLADFIAHDGFVGLRRALDLSPGAIVKEVTDSGLRGRGGAAFPTGIKWKTVADTVAAQKYIVCNADEGDSGTFADRMLMEGDPYLLIEGMVIAGLAVGATQGFVYVRSEYPHAERVLRHAIGLAAAAGYLGDNILGSGRTFALDVRRGAGAYICGEETALLESLEGRRGQIRYKPPLPAHRGLFGQPTAVNNVISLATVPVILQRGAAYYADFGRGRSRGTQPFQLAGNVRYGGLIEKAFGLTLGELIHDWGGGSASGRPVRTAQVGGPLGAYLPVHHFDTPLDYEAFAAKSAMLGHGGVVVFDDSVDMAAMARFAMEFCAVESCGKCTPCRLGAVRGRELIEHIVAGRDVERNLATLRDLCDTMINASLCALGGMAPFPVLSALEHFPDDFVRAGRNAA
ncbi:MAG: NADH-quinone oxidoreductase subunit NuoF [Gammaproteobacteria bacterium]|nr:NADH-quinone oxidoreductase subunit NuoF [Gammaproteobacteria bacterium]